MSYASFIASLALETVEIRDGMLADVIQKKSSPIAVVAYLRGTHLIPAIDIVFRKFSGMIIQVGDSTYPVDDIRSAVIDRITEDDLAGCQTTGSLSLVFVSH